LTNDPGNERDPSWGPDGRAIAFAYDGNGNWDIYTLTVPVGFAAELSRNEWRQISQSPLDERYPAWLP
jgi:Tol biopolymer transport system component